MTTEELRQLFKNNSDCHADTWHSERGFMEEGEVIQSMTEDKFIEVIEEILNEEVDKQRRFQIEKFDENTEWFNWLSQSKSNGLNPVDLNQAIRDISKRLNEISDALNSF